MPPTQIMNVTVNEASPLTAEKLAAFGADGWALAGGWGLRNDLYGRQAVNLQFVRVITDPVPKPRLRLVEG